MRYLKIASSHPRLVAAVAAGILTYSLAPTSGARIVISWDAGAGIFLCLCGISMTATSPDQISDRAAALQDGEWTVFALTLAGIVASVFVIVIEFGELNANGMERILHLLILVITIVLSWLTTQVLFGLRYAHLFYTMLVGDAQRGLEFPGEPNPDYLDFFYFSLVIGMTFQVSDVKIADRHLRRLAAVHAFISFLFNMVLLALTVNLAAGLFYNSRT
jgi:uncharacterized membrane protein